MTRPRRESVRVRDVSSVIEEYINIQELLVSGLKKELGERDWHHVSDVPRTGDLTLDGETWHYSVHGAGVRFTSRGCSIDMNRRLDGSPYAFDAGRIAEFLETAENRRVRWGDDEIVFDHERGAALLREMCAMGELVRVEDDTGELFLLASAGGDTAGRP